MRIDEAIKSLKEDAMSENPRDATNLAIQLGKVDNPTYECTCGTTFKKSDAHYSGGWLACPSCGNSEDLTIVSPEEVNAEAVRKIIATS